MKRIEAYNVVVRVPIVASNDAEARRLMQSYLSDLEIPGNVVDPGEIVTTRVSVCSSCELEECECSYVN